jgi:hypothetical protein
MGKFQLTRRSRRHKAKLFTIEEADRALPLVRRIVADIVAQFRQLERLQRRRRALMRRERDTEVSDLDKQAARGADRLGELIDEVNHIGCELKDWETGIVDFRTVMGGREVYLCWKLGEDHVSYWHELACGMAGRQPLASTPGQP